MSNSGIEAQVKKEGEFVKKVQDRKYQVEELISLIEDLQGKLRPYSTSEPRGKTGQDEPEPPTEMDKALVNLQDEITYAQNKVQHLIENFQG